MARVSMIHEPADHLGAGDPETRKLLDDWFAHYATYSPYTKVTGGKVHNSWSMLLHDPKLAHLVLNLSDHIMHHMEWCLREDLRELMVQTQSKRIPCEYNFTAHVNIAAAEWGLSLEKQTLIEFPDNPIWSDEERTVIKFTNAVIDGDVPDDLFAEAHAIFGDRGMLEFTVAIAYWQFWATIINTMKPEIVPLGSGGAVPSVEKAVA